MKPAARHAFLDDITPATALITFVIGGALNHRAHRRTAKSKGRHGSNIISCNLQPLIQINRRYKSTEARNVRQGTNRLDDSWRGCAPVAMQDFILQQNIARYRARLAEEQDEGARRVIARLLVQTEREYALMSSAEAGAATVASGFRNSRPAVAVQRYLTHFRQHLAGSGDLFLVLDPGPGLPILEASDS